MTDTIELPRCGMIFEFKKMKQAEAFAAAVDRRFDLECRVFDDAEAAEASHAFPWAQKPPVVHVDRPWWGTEPGSSEWDAAWKLERQIEDLAEKKFGGQFVGT